MQALVEGLQEQICAAIESFDTATFEEDVWERPEGGGGKTASLQGTPSKKAV